MNNEPNKITPYTDAQFEEDLKKNDKTCNKINTDKYHIYIYFC
jgi:hypothetical protein